MSSKVNTGQLKSLQKEYQSTLAPTADETATSTSLDNLISSRDLGIVKVNAQPIASDFTQGQGAGLIRQTAAQAQPLEQKLARLQATRASAADVLKAKLGFETTNVQTQIAEKAAKDAKKAQEKTFAEQQRQFNTNFGLQQQQENRLAGQQGSSDGILAAILKLQNGGGQPTAAGFNYGDGKFGTPISLNGRINGNMG